MRRKRNKENPFFVFVGFVCRTRNASWLKSVITTGYVKCLSYVTFLVAESIILVGPGCMWVFCFCFPRASRVNNFLVFSICLLDSRFGLSFGAISKKRIESNATML